MDIFAAAGLRKPDIPILSDEFLSEVKGMRQRNLVVDLLHKLLSNESKAQSKKFQSQSRSFSELLEATLRKYQKSRDRDCADTLGTDRSGKRDPRGEQTR